MIEKFLNAKNLTKISIMIKVVLNFECFENKIKKKL